MTLNYKIIRETYIRHMRSHVGARETHGKNRSPMIDAINKRAKSYKGAPYCLAGATATLDDVCKELGLKNPVGVHAGTQSWWGKVSKQYKRGSAKAGFIGIYQNRTDRAHGHAVVVVSDEDTDHIYKSVEFNTNPGGDRDGDGVHARNRKVTGDSRLVILGFVDVVQWICDANGVQV